MHSRRHLLLRLIPLLTRRREHGRHRARLIPSRPGRRDHRHRRLRHLPLRWPGEPIAPILEPATHAPVIPPSSPASSSSTLSVASVVALLDDLAITADDGLITGWGHVLGGVAAARLGGGQAAGDDGGRTRDRLAVVIFCKAEGGRGGVIYLVSTAERLIGRSRRAGDGATAVQRE